METPTIWGLNNSHRLFWEGRIEANDTIQIINIKAVRIESHKQSLQLIWLYSKK